MRIGEPGRRSGDERVPGQLIDGAGTLKHVLLSALAGIFAGTTVAQPPATPDAQRQHARGTCGSLGPGTGLSAEGKGWIVSMLPGRHEVRVRGGGTAWLTVARQTALEFDAGRPYYLVVEGAAAGAVLEWKVPGHDWAPVPKTFLYPPQGVTPALGRIASTV